MTKSGIERDLNLSPYVSTMDYGTHMISFRFSSRHAMMKFEENYEENRQRIAESLSNRFKMKFCIGNDFCDVVLYRQIERRGFLLISDWGEAKWPGELEYDGIRILHVS